VPTRSWSRFLACCRSSHAPPPSRRRLRRSTGGGRVRDQVRCSAITSADLGAPDPARSAVFHPFLARVLLSAGPVRSSCHRPQAARRSRQFPPNYGANPLQGPWVTA
jgi:hypothetical protein